MPGTPSGENHSSDSQKCGRKRMPRYSSSSYSRSIRSSSTVPSICSPRSHIRHFKQLLVGQFYPRQCPTAGRSDCLVGGSGLAMIRIHDGQNTAAVRRTTSFQVLLPYDRLPRNRPRVRRPESRPAKQLRFPKPGPIKAPGRSFVDGRTMQADELICRRLGRVEFRGPYESCEGGAG